MDKENEIKLLETKYEKLVEKKREFLHKINLIENEIKIVNKNIYKLKEEIAIPKLTKIVKKMDTEDLLTDSEIIEIYKGMDKKDYSDVGIDLWLDIEKIILSILNYKKKHQTLNPILINVKLMMSEDRYPPNNYYNYTFKGINDICLLSNY